jgi:UDP-N-acetylglucosamine--N-acetylmuramyl-(pentapeptide) pyrophosphoryl-undecaprenol N-acetylglucosamine transferase
MASGGAAPLVLLAAGGTGGHLFPAQALADALAKRGVTVDLATDERATRYGQDFPARATHIVPSDTVRGGNPLVLARTVWTLGLGLGHAYALLGRLRPAVVVGFGGYPTIPPILAAVLRGIPTLIHEQNGVMGRANRLLAGRVTAIATGFRDVSSAAPKLAAKTTFTGNPVRPAVVAAATTPYDAPGASSALRLLVFGGSQGARVMADIVPPAVEALDPALRARLAIVQQAREEDMERVAGIYRRLGVVAEVEPFFADLPARMASAHLVISRAGASTVAELAAIGRPSILVPLPHALDQDQLANANALSEQGAATVIKQEALTPRGLTQEIAGLASFRARLSEMAQSARAAGTLDAADRLADLVLRVANVIPPTSVESGSKT